MEPTYHHGRWLLLRRLNWPQVPLRHGEVVVFRLDGDLLIKRVAALPGEYAPLDDLNLLRYRRPSKTRYGRLLAKEVSELLRPIPERHLYVLGDNAESSEDSRLFGAVPGQSVIGRVIQWNPPDPPERPQIGYMARKNYDLLARARPSTLPPAVAILAARQ
jgi:signal peptidase I